MVFGQKQNLGMIIYKNIGQDWQIIFVKLSRFYLLRFLGESVEKGKFAMETSFQIVLNEVLKSCKNKICWADV